MIGRKCSGRVSFQDVSVSNNLMSLAIEHRNDNGYGQGSHDSVKTKLDSPNNSWNSNMPQGDLRRRLNRLVRAAHVVISWEPEAKQEP